MNPLAIVLPLLACLLLAPACPAEEPGSDVHTQTITIGKLREAITNQEEKIDQSRLEEQALQNELAALDEKIRKQRDKIAQLQAKIVAQEKVIRSKDAELALINQKNEALRQHLIHRLRTYYFRGHTGFVNIMFTSKTLPDLLLNNDAFQYLVTYDQSVFADYRRSVNDIGRVKQAQELEKSVQEIFLADADTENAVLQQAIEEKSVLLKQAQTKKGLFEQALKEMKRSENELRAALTRSHRVEEGKSRGFLLNRGKLPPPVWGELLHRFQEIDETEDPIFANGITIKIPERAEVFAVYDGNVIYAAAMSGYGNTVIIDHGRQYHSVTARLGELRVREGEQVLQGQEIGRTGKAAAPLGPTLYFEIRHGAVAENPLNWLQSEALTLPRSAAP